MVNGDVNGSYIAVEGNAEDNNVTIASTGVVQADIYGGFTNQGEIKNNSVLVSGAANNDIYGGYSADGNSSGNNVTITSSGTVQANIYGSYTYQGEATNNSVLVSGTANNDVYGSYSADGNATHNTVEVSGSVANDIYGGFTWNGDASNNNITVSGTAENSITGGYSMNGNAINNTININRNAQLASSVQLVGGNSTNDSFSGNTLNLNKWTGTVNQLQNFEHYSITLPESFKENDTVINISGSTSTLLNNPNNPSQKANFIINNVVGVLVNTGDKFTVISNTAMSDNSIYQVMNQGLQGIGVQYDYSLANAGNGTPLEFTILQTRVNPQTKSLQQVRNASASFLNTSADFVINQGLKAASYAQLLTPSNEDSWGLGIFAIGGGSSVKQKTGSHVDVDGVNFIAGLSISNHNLVTPVTLSAFFEAGDGNYNSYNDFAGAPKVTADGDVSYKGGGVMGKLENLVGNLYLEGSFRFGRYKSDYSSGNFYVPGYLGGVLPKFDLNSNYYSAHAGLGYVFDLSESLKVDTALKYLWSYLDGSNVTLLGDKFQFDDMNSHRLQAGGRLFWNMQNKIVSPYIGAWYEYEFDGKSTGSVQGFVLPETELKGSTGIFEAGLTVRPNESPLEIDLVINGLTGRREGIGGYATLNWKF